MNRYVLIVAFFCAACRQNTATQDQAARTTPSPTGLAVATEQASLSRIKHGAAQQTFTKVTDADREEYEGFSDIEIRIIKTDTVQYPPETCAGGYYVAADYAEPENGEAIRIDRDDPERITYERGHELVPVSDATVMTHFTSFTIDNQEHTLVCFKHHVETFLANTRDGENDQQTYFFPSKKSLKVLIEEEQKQSE